VLLFIFFAPYRLLETETQIYPKEGVSLDYIAAYNKDRRLTPGAHRLRYFADFGIYDSEVPMSPDDKAALVQGSQGNPGFPNLLLLGFKPRESIPFYHKMQESYFCYPNDDKVTGSKTAFAHLHASMLRKNVVAIGELLTRVHNRSNLVALIPVEKEVIVDEDGAEEIVCPQCMMCVYLPFEDDLRELVQLETDAGFQIMEQEGANIASEQLVEAATKLIDKQTLESEFGVDFVNADLANFWLYLEHVALEEPWEPKHNYDTVVTKEHEEILRKYIGDEIDKVAALLPEDVMPEKVGRKRTFVEDDSGLDWHSLYDDRALGKLKVDDLKKYLRTHQLPLGGRKTDVLARVMEHIESTLRDVKKEVDNVKMEIS
jgi:ATP-dependent DNA helicase 2 subunit 1